MKGLHLYPSHMIESTNDKIPKIEDHLVLQEFKDLFPYEYLGPPLSRDINFSTNLMP